MEKSVKAENTLTKIVKIMKRIIVLIIVASITQEAKSQNFNDSLSVSELPEVVVSAQGFSNFINANTSNYNILSEQISLIRPEKVTETFQFLPGVYSVPDGIGGQALNIRGFDQNRINIYYNGIPVRSNTEGKISTDGLFFTNSDFSIEKGSSSLIYGSNSSGNIIRIDNRIFTPELFGINVNTYIGNNSKRSLNTTITGRVKNKFYYQASANYYYRNSFRLSDNFDTTSVQQNNSRLNSFQNNLELLGIFTYAPSARHYISITGLHNQSEFGYPPSIVSPRYRKMDFWHNTMIGVRHKSLLGEKFVLESNIYSTFLIDTLNEYTDKTFTKIKRYSYWNDRTLGFRGVLTYHLTNRHRFNYLIDYKNDNHEQAWFTTATTKANTFISAVEYKGSLSKSLSIDAGTSYNLSNPSYSSKNDNVIRKELSSWNYQISMGYNIEAYKIYGGYSKTSIFPRMRDLFGDVLIGYTPNPNLTTEQSDNFNVGLNSQFLSDKLIVEVNGFYNHIKDLLTQIKDSDTTNQVINLQSATFSGGEIMIKYFPSKNLFAMASYSFLDPKNTSENRTSDNIAYLPKNQIRAFTSYTISKYFIIDFTFSFISNRKYNIQGNWESLNEYSVVDIGFSSEIVKNFSIWFKASNLFDTNYLGAYDQPQPGREYKIGLSYNYKQKEK